MYTEQIKAVQGAASKKLAFCTKIRWDIFYCPC